jgi:type I restriction enzyme M protein
VSGLQESLLESPALESQAIVSAAAKKSLLPTPPDSEVDAYAFIREQLREIGWSVKNPSRAPEGQVWTQNQIFAEPALKRALGLDRPENVVRLTATRVWVIEAKRKRSEIAKALKEAEDDYAGPINAAGEFEASLITGVAGNDSTGYEVRTRLLVGSRYEPVTINGREATGLLDPQVVQQLLDSGDPAIADVPINEELFLKSAERINRTLHMGGINKNDRARVMAALLLSLLEDPGPSVESELAVLIGDINNRTRSVLDKHGKVEFHPFVVITPPTNSDNHVKFRKAIIETLQELNNLSIKSAMNSGADVLGKFYEVFLKYGNGAKEIGIVLTPRHVTRFAVEALGVSVADLVFDPACGTGGFLVAALDHVRKKAHGAPLERFKLHNLFGIEQESYVAALAIVNMIFRGDGKNNIVEANALTRFLTRTTVSGNPSARYGSDPPSRADAPVTRVLMNPPACLTVRCFSRSSQSP